jgi:hypothetical protein
MLAGRVPQLRVTSPVKVPGVTVTANDRLCPAVIVTEFGSTLRVKVPVVAEVIVCVNTAEVLVMKFRSPL